MNKFRIEHCYIKKEKNILITGSKTYQKCQSLVLVSDFLLIMCCHCWEILIFINNFTVAVYLNTIHLLVNNRIIMFPRILIMKDIKLLIRWYFTCWLYLYATLYDHRALNPNEKEREIKLSQEDLIYSQHRVFWLAKDQTTCLFYRNVQLSVIKWSRTDGQKS